MSPVDQVHGQSSAINDYLMSLNITHRLYIVTDRHVHILQRSRFGSFFPTGTHLYQINIS